MRHTNFNVWTTWVRSKASPKSTWTQKIGLKSFCTFQSEFAPCLNDFWQELGRWRVQWWAEKRVKKSEKSYKKTSNEKTWKNQKDTWENLKKQGKITRHEQTWKQITLENLKKNIQKNFKWENLKKPKRIHEKTWKNMENNKTWANLKTNHTRKPEKKIEKNSNQMRKPEKSMEKKQQWNKNASEHFEQSICQMRTPKNILESISKTEKLEKIQEK